MFQQLLSHGNSQGLGFRDIACDAVAQHGAAVFACNQRIDRQRISFDHREARNR